MMKDLSLILIFLFSLVFLLITMMRFRLNAFVSLILTSFITGLLAGRSPADIAAAVAEGFSATVGSVGIVTGMGVMLGTLLYEAGGIHAVAWRMIRAFGKENAPTALGAAAYLAGIPIFGDVVTVLFSSVVRTLSKETGISRLSFVASYAVAASIAAACVIPTAGPLAVCANMRLNPGVFFVYAVLAGLAGFLTGGILWGNYLDRQEKKRNLAGGAGRLANGERQEDETDRPGSGNISFRRAMWVMLIPILMILAGSFAPLFLPEGCRAVSCLAFAGDKNLAMTVGVLCAMWLTGPYIKGGTGRVMESGLDRTGMILLITGAGGAFGKVLQLTGVGDCIADIFGSLHIPVLVLGFVLSQLLRLAQGSTTAAVTTASAILYPAVSVSGTSPVLAAIAICAGGVGLSLPNDSGFWSISRFNRISVQDTFRCWTIGGFLGGLGILGAVLVLSLFQEMLPGLH